MNEQEQEIKRLIKRFECYQKGQDSGYFDVEELLVLAHHYTNCGDTKAMNEISELAQKIHPNSEETIKIKVIVHIYNNRLDKALSLIEQLHSNDIETILIKTTTLLALNKLSEVRKLTDRLLQEDILEPEMICDISKCYITTNHMKLGLEFLKKCETHFPDNPDIIFQIGEMHDMLGNIKKAEKSFLRIIDDNPFDAEAWFNLADIYSRTEDYGKALEAINYSLAVDPHDIVSIQLKADILCITRRNKEAIQTLLDALKEGADAFEIYSAIGRNYLIMDENEKALDWFAKAETKKPNNIRTILNRFDAYIGLKQIENACNELDLMARHQVPLYLIWERKGLIESLIGRFEDARKSYKKAVKWIPDNPYLWAKLSMVEWELGNYNATKRYINKALDIDHSFLYGYMVLASAYCKLHQYNKMLDIVGSPIFTQDPNNVVFFELCPEMEPNFNQIIDALKHKKDINHLLVAPTDDSNN